MNFIDSYPSSEKDLVSRVCQEKENICEQNSPWADPYGGQGVRTPSPPENHKIIGCLGNTSPSQSYQASIQFKRPVNYTFYRLE